MGYISGVGRSQQVLFPEAIDDYITADNPVRFLDAFVESLDLAALGFGRTTPASTGRPGYAPADLLKLYLYGYLHKTAPAAAWTPRPSAMRS
jgi:transposase